MANFWDLPKDVRFVIYRLHLVQDEPVSEPGHRQLAKHTVQQRRHRPTKRMPSICAVSPKADRESAPIYYGENHFVFDEDSRVGVFVYWTCPRHYRKIRKLTIQWPKPTMSYGAWGGVAREAFLDIGRLAGLQELFVRVNEEEMARDMLWSRLPRRSKLRNSITPITRQDNLAVLRHPGMTGLLTLHDIPRVDFVKALDYAGNEIGGPIPGGVLETEVAPKLRGSKKVYQPGRDDAFQFFLLPPELRNRIYGMLLHVEGPLVPTPRAPSSAPKGGTYESRRPGPGSALNILAANRQIHDEAVGIFYHTNEFLFRTPPQLAAFIVSLGELRAKSLRDITLHYQNDSGGGVELASIALPMLRQLTGLRKLHISCDVDIWAVLYRGWVNGLRPFVFDLCNPNRLPGIRSLFNLRNVTDIKFSDIRLDKELEDLKKHRLYPDKFDMYSQEKATMRLGEVMKHFNAALADAQLGKLNVKLLADDKWPTRDELPVIEEVEDSDETEPVADEGEAEADDERDEVGNADAEDQTQGEAGPVMFDGIVLGHRPAVETIRDRLRSSTRAAGRISEVQVTTEEMDGDNNLRVSSGRNEDGPASNGTEDAAEVDDRDQMADDATEQDDANQMDDDVAEEDEMEDEIVVKYWSKASVPTTSQTKRAIARLDGFDGASDEAGDEMEDEEGDESYWAREPSPEL